MNVSLGFPVRNALQEAIGKSDHRLPDATDTIFDKHPNLLPPYMSFLSPLFPPET
jgi:hypothetical protein